MSFAIENCKGHVHVFSETGGDGGRSTGFYEMDPPIPHAEDSRALILGIPIGFQEIVQPSVTLDDKRTLYVFGTAWSQLTVNGILLLGQSSTKGAQLDELISWYEENRVSEKRAPIRISLGTTGLNAYVVGLRTTDANPQFNTQNFSILMMTAEIQSQA